MALDLNENGSGLVAEPGGHGRNSTHACTCVMLQCRASDSFLETWRRRLCLIHPFKAHQDCHCPEPFTLYPVPRRRVERKKWLRIVNRKDPRTGSLLSPRQPHVCSKHFKGGAPSQDHPLPSLNLGYEKEVIKPDVLDQVYDQSRILPRSVLENEESPFSALEVQPESDNESTGSEATDPLPVRIKSEPRSENGSDYGDRKRSLEDRLLETENPESGAADAGSSILNSGTDMSSQGSEDFVSATKRRKIKEEPPDAYECDTDEYDAGSSETTITTTKPEADVKMTLQIKIEPIDVETFTSGSEKASPVGRMSKGPEGGTKLREGAVVNSKESVKSAPLGLGERGKFMPSMSTNNSTTEVAKIPAVCCAVIKCEIASYAGKRVRCFYHKSTECVCARLYPFPSNLAERKRWLVLLNRRSATDPSKYYHPDSQSVVCGRHFPEGRPTVFYPFPTLHLGYSPLPTDTYHFSLIRYPWFQAPSVMIQKNQAHNRDKTYVSLQGQHLSSSSPKPRSETRTTQTEPETLVLTRDGSSWAVASALHVAQVMVNSGEKISPQPIPVPVGGPVPIMESIYNVNVPSTSGTSVSDVIGVGETGDVRNEREIFSLLEKSPAEESYLLGDSDPMIPLMIPQADDLVTSRESSPRTSSSKAESEFASHQSGARKTLTKIAPRLTMP